MPGNSDNSRYQALSTLSRVNKMAGIREAASVVSSEFIEEELSENDSEDELKGFFVDSSLTAPSRYPESHEKSRLRVCQRTSSSFYGNHFNQVCAWLKKLINQTNQKHFFQ